MKTNKIYLPGLNGIRALAALSILVSHVSVSAFLLNNFNIYSISNGVIDGVTIFFVLSGFLITYLLLHEKDKIQTINIKKFYFRRILRIWPIYYLLIGVSSIIALSIPHIQDIYTINLFYYIFFAANIPFLSGFGITIIVHYWSIGVEEQFYIFWPWVVKLKKTNLLVFTLLFIIIFFIVKSYFWYFLGNTSLLYKFMAVSRFHCMLMGCAAAILYKNNNTFFNQFFTSVYSQILTWFLLIVFSLKLVYIPAPVRSEVVAVLAVLLIMGQLSKKRIVNLENTFLNFLGRISYGIYLIHPLVILIYSKFIYQLTSSILINTVIVYLTVALITIALAYISYEYFEKRFLRLKSKYAIIKSTNTKL